MLHWCAGVASRIGFMGLAEERDGVAGRTVRGRGVSGNVCRIIDRNPRRGEENIDFGILWNVLQSDIPQLDLVLYHDEASDAYLV